MSLTRKSLLVRTAILAVIVAAMISLLAPRFRVIRHEHQVKSALLEIQRALQDWHVAEEIYPRQTPMTGADLIGLLVDSGHLERPPFNPWTGQTYRVDAESPESDRIRYATDELAETYSLRALNRADEGILFELDSTEHQSLE